MCVCACGVCVCVCVCMCACACVCVCVCVCVCGRGGVIFFFVLLFRKYHLGHLNQPITIKETIIYVVLYNLKHTWTVVKFAVLFD